MGLLKKLLRAKPIEKKRPFTSAVIVAAGKSDRMAGINKLFTTIAGIPVLAYSLKAFDTNDLIDEIVVVSQPDTIADIGAMCKVYSISKLKCVLRGGDTRQASVYIGINEVSANTELIAVHDGARPLVTQRIISETVIAANEYGGAIPAVKVTDTIKIANEAKVIKTPDRENLFAAQTPQVFKSELIKAGLTQAIEKNIDLTDDSMAAELLGAGIRIVNGSYENIKITYPIDIYTAEAIVGQRAADGE